MSDCPQNAAPGKVLTPAAKRALNEAAERKACMAEKAKNRLEETSGPKGEEPTRFGDWERNGIAYDF
ncbi:MAG: DUF1674 domain-containing protein [Maricaulaceae bacterium]